MSDVPTIEVIADWRENQMAIEALARLLAADERELKEKGDQ